MRSRIVADPRNKVHLEQRALGFRRSRRMSANSRTSLRKGWPHDLPVHQYRAGAAGRARPNRGESVPSYDRAEIPSTMKREATALRDRARQRDRNTRALWLPHGCGRQLAPTRPARARGGSDRRAAGPDSAATRHRERVRAGSISGHIPARERHRPAPSVDRPAVSRRLTWRVSVLPSSSAISENNVASWVQPRISVPSSAAAAR
jgi:hypothetical protein